jgi:single-strand DNA-binding protein
MAGFNKAIIIGRLGQDPEMRTTPTGMPVANFSVATSEKSKEGVEVTEWHRCILFGKQAELAGKFLAKGRQVYLEGKIQTKQWKDKQGNPKSATEILCNQMVFLDSFKSETKSETQDMYSSSSYEDSDIPF